MKRTFGFTMVEILAVVGIISILATIGLSSYSSVQKKARDGKRTSDLELIRAAIEQYRSNNNDYPASLPFPASGGNLGLCDPSGCAAGKYIDKVPTDPIPSQVYWYQRVSSSDYTICALLSSGTSVSGTDCIQPGAQACNYCVGPYGQK